MHEGITWLKSIQNGLLVGATKINFRCYFCPQKACEKVGIQTNVKSALF